MAGGTHYECTWLCRDAKLCTACGLAVYIILAWLDVGFGHSCRMPALLMGHAHPGVAC